MASSKEKDELTKTKCLLKDRNVKENNKRKENGVQIVMNKDGYIFLINQALKASARTSTELGGSIVTREGNHGPLIHFLLGFKEKVVVGLDLSTVSVPTK